VLHRHDALTGEELVGKGEGVPTPAMLEGRKALAQIRAQVHALLKSGTITRPLVARCVIDYCAICIVAWERRAQATVIAHRHMQELGCVCKATSERAQPIAERLGFIIRTPYVERGLDPAIRRQLRRGGGPKGGVERAYAILPGPVLIAALGVQVKRLGLSTPETRRLEQLELERTEREAAELYAAGTDPALLELVIAQLPPRLHSAARRGIARARSGDRGAAGGPNSAETPNDINSSSGGSDRSQLREDLLSDRRGRDVIDRVEVSRPPAGRLTVAPPAPSESSGHVASSQRATSSCNPPSTLATTRPREPASPAPRGTRAGEARSPRPAQETTTRRNTRPEVARSAVRDTDDDPRLERFMQEVGRRLGLVAPDVTPGVRSTPATNPPLADEAAARARAIPEVEGAGAGDAASRRDAESPPDVESARRRSMRGGELRGDEVVEEAYIQVGLQGRKVRVVGRGIVPHLGGVVGRQDPVVTVEQVIGLACEHRRNVGAHEREPLFIAVFVKGEGGIVGRYSTRLESGATAATWEQSG
jgi:hypothetical protein